MTKEEFYKCFLKIEAYCKPYWKPAEKPNDVDERAVVIRQYYQFFQNWSMINFLSVWNVMLETFDNKNRILPPISAFVSIHRGMNMYKPAGGNPRYQEIPFERQDLINKQGFRRVCEAMIEAENKQANERFPQSNTSFEHVVTCIARSLEGWAKNNPDYKRPVRG